MLHLSQKIYNEIISHAKKSYPCEGCGALVGKDKKITKIYPLENINKERANDRYEINPKDLLRVEKEAKKDGFEVIGFFHSHPDHPDRPSDFDRQRAWPFYSYVIVAVQNGKDVSVKSWTFENEGEPFREEEIETV
ncbi:MAG: M67 family metallopeptidase [Deltaproteobacteria bacterium]|nr:M67 family metallopeptidase [Deltaproteobacteria bacterium]